MTLLLAIAYRVFRSPFAAWALLALTIALLLTAFAKAVCWVLLPGALRPDTLRSAFQLAPFAFIPLAVYFGLAQFRWKRMRTDRRVFTWSDRRALLTLAAWILVLFGLFGFNLSAFPK